MNNKDGHASMKDPVFVVGQRIRYIKKTPAVLYDHGVLAHNTDTRGPKFGDICVVTDSLQDPSGDVAGINNVVSIEGYGDMLFSSRRFEPV